MEGVSAVYLFYTQTAKPPVCSQFLHLYDFHMPNVEDERG